MNENSVEKSDIILRYKKSLTVDSFFTFVLTIGLVISLGIAFEVNGLNGELIALPIFIFALSHIFLQDFIFHRSIGKRIYKLRIVTKIESKKKLLKALVMRKFYEATYHPLFNKDFAAIVNMMEAMTETKIVDDIKTLPKQ
jgi:hypothetical protein